MEPGEGVAIAPVGLDAIAASLGHARRIDDHAVLTLRGQEAMNPKAAGPGFVDEAQPPGRRPQGLEQLRQRLKIARHPAVVPHLAVPPILRERDVDRFLVDIHPHEHATFRHGLPPSYVALRYTGSVSRNPRSTT
jgi:hypothetical protein